MIRLQRLLDHASVQVLTRLVLLSVHGRGLRQFFLGRIDGLGCTVRERHAHSLAVLGEDLAAGRDLGLFEHLSRAGNLLLVLAHVLLDSHRQLIGNLLLEQGLHFDLGLGCCHFGFRRFIQLKQNKQVIYYL